MAVQSWRFKVGGSKLAVQSWRFEVGFLESNRKVCVSDPNFTFFSLILFSNFLSSARVFQRLEQDRNRVIEILDDEEGKF